MVDDFRHEASTVQFLGGDGTVSDERSFEDRTVRYAGVPRRPESRMCVPGFAINDPHAQREARLNLLLSVGLRIFTCDTLLQD